MRSSLAALLIITGPAEATAAWSVEASLGQGLLLSPKPVGAAQATSIGVAVGYRLLEPVEAQLVLLPQVDALDAGAFELELRAALKIGPPRFPGYGRMVAGFTRLVGGPRRLAVGGGVGWQVRVSGVSWFVEVVVLPRAGSGKGGVAKMQWIAEGRAGGAFHF